ncbi:HAD-IIIA family hydrolase [Asanoa sp. NPDC049573]|uniref:HAD-IIIA family hydrolase n=1 Tax=Asanoa sp. NPDC049573 TaxID=3155396 RepID=UPI003425978D
MSRPAHFFDLGGTLLALDDQGEIGYDTDGRVTVLPGVPQKLAALVGSPVFVVTNQAGIAEGTLSRERFDDFCSQLTTAVPGAITAVALCAHARDAGCFCRKPRPGLVHRLAAAHDLDLSASVLVGDSETDRQLASNAGIGAFQWAHRAFA